MIHFISFWILRSFGVAVPPPPNTGPLAAVPLSTTSQGCCKAKELHAKPQTRLLSFFHTSTDKKTEVWHWPRSQILTFYITGLLIRCLLSRSSIQVVCLRLRSARQPISEPWKRWHFRFFRNKSRGTSKTVDTDIYPHPPPPKKKISVLNASFLAWSTIMRLPQKRKENPLVVFLNRPTILVLWSRHILIRPYSNNFIVCSSFYHIELV